MIKSIKIIFTDFQIKTDLATLLNKIQPVPLCPRLTWQIEYNFDKSQIISVILSSNHKNFSSFVSDFITKIQNLW